MSSNYTIALFGEAEKGDYQTPYFCQTLPELVDHLGHPPKESTGLYYATQAILFHRDLIFFRVREEGFSLQDYLRGLYLLKSMQSFPRILAISMPGMGNKEIIEETSSICSRMHAIFIMTEADLYDYLTHV